MIVDHEIEFKSIFYVESPFTKIVLVIKISSAPLSSIIFKLQNDTCVLVTLNSGLRALYQ